MKPILKNALLYGTFTGLISFGVFLLIYIAGMNPLNPVGLTGVLATLFFIPWSMVMAREKTGLVVFPYGQAFVTGLFITLAYAIVSVILVFLFLNFFDPSLMDDFKENSLMEIEKAIEMNPSMEDFLEASIDQLMLQTPLSYALGELLNKIIGGILIVLIAAIFIKRKPSPFES